MTDEERRNLCANLRADATVLTPSFAGHNKEAAYELERLTILAQSDAEPVAWRYRVKGSSSWFVALNDDAAYWRASNYEVEPLYAARVMDQWRNKMTSQRMAVDDWRAMIDETEAQTDAEPIRAFAKAVLHGDDEHKAWLIEAAEAFIAGKPLPAPRGKGTKQSDAEPVAVGWQTVPKEPTEEMVEAYFAAHARAKTVFEEVLEIWKAMLDAAPAPPRPNASAG